VFLGDLQQKKITREEWLEQCASLKIAGVCLAGPKATAAAEPSYLDTFYPSIEKPRATSRP
jgi:hypothetical protein